MSRRIVIITGGGIGIGRATARAFGSLGDHVVVTDILGEEGEAVAGEIKQAGGSAEFHKLDVRSSTAADALVSDVEKRHGRIDVVIANAGIAHKVPLAELSDERWDHTFD